MVESDSDVSSLDSLGSGNFASQKSSSTGKYVEVAVALMLSGIIWVIYITPSLSATNDDPLILSMAITAPVLTGACIGAALVSKNHRVKRLAILVVGGVVMGVIPGSGVGLAQRRLSELDDTSITSSTVSAAAASAPSDVSAITFTSGAVSHVDFIAFEDRKGSRDVNYCLVVSPLTDSTSTPSPQEYRIFEGCSGLGTCDGDGLKECLERFDRTSPSLVSGGVVTSSSAYPWEILVPRDYQNVVNLWHANFSGSGYSVNALPITIIPKDVGAYRSQLETMIIATIIAAVSGLLGWFLVSMCCCPCW